MKREMCEKGKDNTDVIFDFSSPM